MQNVNQADGLGEIGTMETPGFTDLIKQFRFLWFSRVVPGPAQQGKRLTFHRAGPSDLPHGGGGGRFTSAMPAHPNRFPVRPLPPSAFRLLEGPLKERQDVHARHLEAIEADRLLAPYRIQAGLAPRAERYGGWESRDISGHSLGHYLSALCHLHAATGAEWVRPRIEHIVAELAACQAANADGYVLPVEKAAFTDIASGRLVATPFSLNGVWVPFYTLHKVLAGLRDAHRMANLPAALETARGVGDWLERTLAALTEDQIQDMLRCEHGGMNEVLADLSADTGDGRFLNLAARCFHHEAVLAPMFRGEDRLDGLHGNTQIPKVIGLAREYELTGKPDYRRAATSFWDHVVNHRSYATGGHGESEHFFPPSQFPQRLTPNTCETCNTYNLLKLTRHLFAWEPDAARMDFVERALINHLAANLGRAPGEFGYFLGLGSVGVKVFSTPYDSWWCCVGTGLENPARYGEQIAFESDGALWLGQYFGASIDWSGMGVKLEIRTRFPEEETIRITVSCATPVRFALKLRHPAWCDLPEVEINGGAVAISSKPSSFLTIERDWRDGDSVVLRLPMQLRAEPLPHSDGKILALMHGPVLLAAMVPDEEGIGNPSTQRFSEHLAARGKTDAFPPVLVADSADEVLAGLHPTGRAPLEFASHGVVKPCDLTFVPLYRIYEEQYAVYFPLLGAAEWQAREGLMRAESGIQRLRDAATLDSITPGYQQPEVDHDYAGENSEIEEFSNRKGRFARDGGWFSYTLRCNGEPAALVLTYWGGVWHERVFDLFIDGQPLAGQRLLANRPGDFFERVIPIPDELTKGREKITLRIVSRRNDTAGSVFSVRLVHAAAAASFHTEPAIVFKDH